MNGYFSNIKQLFFDLDHTLWDFDANAAETLSEMYHAYDLQQYGLDCVSTFIAHYKENNHRLWQQYHQGLISKEALRAQRFATTFKALGMKESDIPASFEEDFVQFGPLKTQLFDQAIEVLQHLSARFPLYIISNGFKTSTHQKIQGSHLYPYFKAIFTSEEIGINKPHPQIFNQILNTVGAQASESLMIGDSIEADIYGALNVQMKALYFNPEAKEKPNDIPFQIHHLSELMTIFP